MTLIKAIGTAENELSEIYIKMKDHEKLVVVLFAFSLLRVGAARYGAGAIFGDSRKERGGRGDEPAGHAHG